LESALGAALPRCKARSGRGVTKFDATSWRSTTAKATVKLRDVLFLCHAKPKNAEQAALWKTLVENTLESPDTWEVALSAGKEQARDLGAAAARRKAWWDGGAANLRLMLAAGVAPKLVADRLEKASPALPFRFVTAYGTLRNSRKQSKKRC